MNKLDKRKKAFLLLATYLIILFTPKFKKEQNKVAYNNNYQIAEDNKFATYNNYNIYICNDEYINKINDDNSNNIYIVDHRYEENPNIRIYNSYRIKCTKEILEILKILLEYENRYPTDWYRTIESMKNEWITHDICYSLGIEIVRTGEVDLDNNDEENYQNLEHIINTLLNDDYCKKEEANITRRLTK